MTWEDVEQLKAWQTTARNRWWWWWLPFSFSLSTTVATVVTVAVVAVVISTLRQSVVVSRCPSRECRTGARAG